MEKEKKNDIYMKLFIRKYRGKENFHPASAGSFKCLFNAGPGFLKKHLFFAYEKSIEKNCDGFMDEK